MTDATRRRLELCLRMLQIHYPVFYIFLLTTVQVYVGRHCKTKPCSIITDRFLTMLTQFPLPKRKAIFLVLEFIPLQLKAMYPGE